MKITYINQKKESKCPLEFDLLDNTMEDMI